MDLYHLILENLTGGIISIDKAGKVLYINPITEKILKIKKEEAINKHYTSAFYKFPEIAEIIYSMINENKTTRRATVEINHSDTLLRIGYSSMMIKDDKDKLIGYTIIFQDLTMVLSYERQ